MDQEAWRTQSRKNTIKSVPRHMILKLENMKASKKILNEIRLGPGMGRSISTKEKRQTKDKTYIGLFFRNHAARGEWMKWSTKKITSLKF
jgi:hypothetical protein